MNYSEAISFLFSSLPMYQRVGKVAYKSTLKTTPKCTLETSSLSELM